MKKVFIFAIFSLLLITCAKDIVVEPPNSLRGFYIGKYYIKLDVNTNTPTTKQSQIELTFTDAQVFGDFIYPDEESRIFCDFRGTYSLEGNLNLNTSEISSQKCIEGEIPYGVFVIKWKRNEEGNDTLTLTQDIPPREIRELIVEKQPDQTD